MLGHQHHHLMFYPNGTCGLNNCFLDLWPVLLRVMIGAKDDQSYCCGQDDVVDDKNMEDDL